MLKNDILIMFNFYNNNKKQTKQTNEQTKKKHLSNSFLIVRADKSQKSVLTNQTFSSICTFY